MGRVVHGIALRGVAGVDVDVAPRPAPEVNGVVLGCGLVRGFRGLETYRAEPGVALFPLALGNFQGGLGIAGEDEGRGRGGDAPRVCASAFPFLKYSEEKTHPMKKNKSSLPGAGRTTFHLRASVGMRKIGTTHEVTMLGVAAVAAVRASVPRLWPRAYPSAVTNHAGTFRSVATASIAASTPAGSNLASGSTS